MPDETAFDHLKRKLTQAPVLPYPSVDHPYILETDVSLQDLGAILSQEQDRRIHPVAYGTLFSQEHNCRITELELRPWQWYGLSVTSSPGGGRKYEPPLHPIPVQRLFQIGYHGIAFDKERKSLCSGLSRLPQQMAHGISSTRSEADLNLQLKSTVRCGCGQ